VDVDPGDTLCAGIDMGLAHDASALVVLKKVPDGGMRILDMLELKPAPNAPLKPSSVCREFAQRMQSVGCSYAVADNHYVETVREYLNEYELFLAPSPPHPEESYIRTREMLREGRLRLPQHPRLLAQMKAVQAVPRPNGRIGMRLPRTAGGHCDLVSALVLAVWHLGGDTVAAPAATLHSEEWEAKERRKRAEAAKKAAQRAVTPSFSGGQGLDGRVAALEQRLSGPRRVRTLW